MVKNTKYVDVLDQDPEIAEQKFACISFLSPENILKDKNKYFFEQFLKKWDFANSLNKFSEFLKFVAYKYNLTFEQLQDDFKDYLKEEGDKLKTTSIEDEYKTFLDHCEDKLEEEFNKEYDFQTSTRGLKIRGVFPSLPEAELRCKLIRDIDKNHDVFVGPVGVWMPWDPVAYKTGRVEHLEPELNRLMHEKKKNDEAAKTAFDNRVKDAKMKAMEENIKNSIKHNNPLTQTMNKDGDLVGIKEIDEKDINESVMENIKKSLFDGDDVVMNKDNDHGLSNLLDKEKNNTNEVVSVNENDIKDEVTSTSNNKKKRKKKAKK